MPRRKFSIALSDFVDTARQNIIDTKTSVRSKLIADFNNQVVQNGLSLETQQAFWEDLMLKENSSEFPTPEFSKTISENIANTKKLIRAKKYRDGLDVLRNDISAKKKTNEDLAAWLQEQLDSAVDADTKEAIRTQITTTNQDVENDYRDMVSNLVDRAKGDHSTTIIQDAYDLAEKRLQKAIANNNGQEVAFWKSQQTVIKQQKYTNQAEDAQNDAQLAVIQNRPAKDILQIWSNAINGASNENVPIRLQIDGQERQFTGIADFLNTKRTAYLNNTGEDGFFEQFRSQQADWLSSQITQWGSLSDTVINNLRSAVDNLANDPVLAAYGNQINSLKYDQTNGLLTKAVNNNADKVISKFTTDYNFDAAANEIQRLSTKFGVNMDTKINALVEDAGKRQQEIIDSVTATANQIWAHNPSGGWEAAVREATKYMTNSTVSPIAALRSSALTLVTAAQKRFQDAFGATSGSTALDSSGKTAGGYTLKIKGIANANPGVVANDAFISAVFQEIYGRNASKAELAQWRGKKVKDVAAAVMGNKSPWYTSPAPAPQPSTTPPGSAPANTTVHTGATASVGQGGSVQPTAPVQPQAPSGTAAGGSTATVPGGTTTTTPPVTPPTGTVTQPPAPKPPSRFVKAKGYTGPSVVDFLSKAVYANDFNTRKTLAKEFKIAGYQNYTGTASQNTELLNKLKADANS